MEAARLLNGSRPNLRILLLTWGPPNVASSRIRAYQYVPYFEKHGWTCRCINTIPLPLSLLKQTLPAKAGSDLAFRLTSVMGKPYSAYSRLYRRWQLAAFQRGVRDCDIVFIQKVLLQKSLRTLLKRLGKQIVFEFDDALHTLGDQQRYDFEAMLQIANLVVTTNRDLEAYARRFAHNTVRIVGPIDTRRHAPAGTNGSSKIVVGWVGSPYTEHNLLSIWEVMKRIVGQRPGVTFHLIGTDRLGFVEGMRSIPWKQSTEVSEIAKFDIGIMPLEDNEWSRGKGGYKLLQYMASGIPAVASPVGVSQELIAHGVDGYLVESSEEWEASLLALIDDQSMRQQMGARARAKATSLYSLDLAAVKMISEFERLVGLESETTVRK